MKIENNNHSLFMLNYKLILTLYDLDNLITEEISTRLKEIFDHISKNYNITSIEWKNGRNYIDVKFKAHPNTELTKFITAFKTAGSKLIKKEYPQLDEKLQQNQFWSKSFFIQTVGENNEEIIRTYIEKLRTFSHRNRKKINTEEEN